MKCTICGEKIVTYLPLMLEGLEDNLCNACVIWAYYTISNISWYKNCYKLYQIITNYTLPDKTSIFSYE